MRDFTKNLFSLSWAMSLFGARQIGNLLNPRQAASGEPGPAQALDSVTSAVVDQLGRGLRQTFEVGDLLQGEIIDVMFRFLPDLGGGGGPAGAQSPAWSSGGSPSWPGAPVAPGLGRPAIFDAHTTADEQVLITYTRGQGRFSDDKQYIALHNQIALM